MDKSGQVRSDQVMQIIGVDQGQKRADKDRLTYRSEDSLATV